YIDSCNDCSTLPNESILSAFNKAEVKKSNNEESSFVICLDDLKTNDIHPLCNVLVQIDISEIDSVDILQKSTCSLEGDSVLSLLHAVDQKLQVVDLQDRKLGRDFLFESGESTDSEVDFSNTHPGINMLEAFTYESSYWNGLLDLSNEIFPWGSEDAAESWSNSSILRSTSHKSPKRHFFYHSSPICNEKHYREYLIASFPNLKVLDNQPISKANKDQAAIIYSDNFVDLPYKRTNKVGCAILPSLHPLSITACIPDNAGGNFRPRQFEYHPSNSSLMVIGTLDGEVVVINHESENVVRYIPSHGPRNRVLGLCWLKRYPTKLIAGSDNGLLKLYDIQHIPSTNGASVTFDEFNQLTSVHVNSLDELFLVSGYSKDVALYDISTGKRLQVFTNMHHEHINVVKFANHSPSMFATSSFDHDVKMWDLRQKPIHPCYTASSGRGNVMVCFSPDDHYLLVSAVDNEVNFAFSQLLFV
ncbi:protein DWD HYPERSENSITIVE TO UV-B 1-like, partial [Bidens hawaiensis]|uniref:protein DWD HYPERSENSITIVE TO UV-B 1-like n=1 Tax=Bidens hawaiensis TaxID=980011 RepID=UPI00404975A9